MIIVQKSTSCDWATIKTRSHSTGKVLVLNTEMGNVVYILQIKSHHVINFRIYWSFCLQYSMHSQRLPSVRFDIKQFLNLVQNLSSHILMNIEIFGFCCRVLTESSCNTAKDRSLLVSSLIFSKAGLPSIADAACVWQIWSVCFRIARTTSWTENASRCFPDSTYWKF